MVCAGGASGEAMRTTGEPTNGPAGAACGRAPPSSWPHAEQKRLPGGLVSPQCPHAMPEGARGEKSKFGAAGRE